MSDLLKVFLAGILGFLVVVFTIILRTIVVALPFILVLLVGYWLFGCGPQHKEPGSCPDTPFDNDTIDTVKDCFVSKDEIEKLKANPSETVTIRGSVSPAFEVTVNNRSFSDIEAYYSHLDSELPKMIEDAGYSDHTAKLQANLGYSDLTNNMAVFIQTTDTRGYQQKTTLDSNGNFTVSVPKDGAGDYKIKATKRLNVLLYQEDKLVATFCYNFSAVDLSVPFTDREKPIVLKSFTTSLTKYSCDQAASSNELSVPKANKSIGSTNTQTSTSIGTSTATSTRSGS
jgi:hypothetical protein